MIAKRLLMLLLSSALMTLALAQDYCMELWEGDPPNYRETGEETRWDTTDIVRASNVQKPDIKVYLPSDRHNISGQAVVICPGGGYRILAYDWEGTDVARWLNSKGIAAIVLKYRLPSSSSAVVPHKVALQDAQRAMRLTRYNAAEWNIDPEKVGIMGFSAGGHLASTLSTHFDAGDPEAGDPVERLSCRPDFSILMYPVVSMYDPVTHKGSRRNLLGEEPDPALLELYSNEKQVSPDTPPAILIHSRDDKSVPVENSIGYYQALVEHGVKAEMHLYDYGGHGYSLAIGKGHLATWPDRVIEFLNYLFP